MGDVVMFTGLTSEDLPPDRVISAALGKNLDQVLILGASDGELYAASSTSNVEWCVTIAERFKLFILAEDSE